MDVVLRETWLSRMPLFPLPRLVLFPGTQLPLHIFESRYRAMVEFCLEESWPMGLAMIQPGYESQQPSDPPIAPVFGVTTISAAQQLNDGRWFVMLSCVARAEYLGEAGNEPFRRVHCRAVDDERGQTSEAAEGTQTLVACLQSLVTRHPDLAEGVGQIIAQADGGSQLADQVAARLVEDVQARQALLAMSDVPTRLSVVVGHIAELLASTTGDLAH